MSMFSEIATESTIKVVVEQIKKDLEENKNKPDAVTALKKIGMFTLTQFEWDTPNWAKEYQKLFEE